MIFNRFLLLFKITYVYKLKSMKSRTSFCPQWYSIDTNSIVFFHRNVPNAMSQLRRMAVVITWSVVTRTVKQNFAGCVLALGNRMDLPGRLDKMGEYIHVIIGCLPCTNGISAFDNCLTS